MPHVTIVDRPCGFGKTSKLLIPQLAEGGPYLVVVPLLSEVDRIIAEAAVPVEAPSDVQGTKTDNLRGLLIDRLNIVTTHAMYSRLARLCREGLLEGYRLVIDEVPSVIEVVSGPLPKSWDEFYVGDGYVEVDPIDGRVSPTAKWVDLKDGVSDSLNTDLFDLASSGRLHVTDRTFFLSVLPVELLSAGMAVTVYTYMTEASYLVAYLNKMGVSYEIDVDPQEDERFRSRSARLITIRDIPSLTDIKWSHTAQGKIRPAEARRIAGAMKSIRQNKIPEVPLQDILVTTRKGLWTVDHQGSDRRAGAFSKGTRMTGANWVANTTRGTNYFIHCSHVFYLYDQHPNPGITGWLGIEGRGHSEAYALSEMVQLVYRSRVRRGEPITLYVPCQRMRNIFTGWLEGDRLRLAA